jgi:sulfonate dioxygenase
MINPVFRKQLSMTVDQQRDLGRHFGPLHKHATYAIPRRGDLDDVVGECSQSFRRTLLMEPTVVYSDKNSRPDLYAFSRAELFHSDVTYEVQPPGATILRLLTTPLQ